MTDIDLPAIRARAEDSAVQFGWAMELYDARQILDALEASRAEAARLRHTIRTMELKVDGLNTRGYTQRKNTQAALDAIKALACEALKGETP